MPFEDYLYEEARTAWEQDRERIRKQEGRAQLRRLKKTAAAVLVTLWIFLATILALLLMVGLQAGGCEVPAEAVPDAEREAYGPAVVLPAIPEDITAAAEDAAAESEQIDELATYNRLDHVKITHYCTELRPHICGTGDGLTASGTEVTAYATCAVDPKVIPLGSTVVVDYGDGETYTYLAEDVGGGVKGNHIDLAVTTHEEALKLGIREATIYWRENHEETS